MATKMRADQALVERGLVESRSRAQALIMAGKVFSNTKRVEKPGQPVPEDMPLEVKGQEHPWVSRGGMKLAHALEFFGLSPEGRVAVDVGASTGGFTDVLLHGGATKVYAVDVGHGQLAWKLRSDPRVVVLEKTNARRLDASQVPEAPGIVVCDASFIGLATVLPAALALAAPGAWAVALIKPQFEAGPDKVGKGGVVRDPAVHEAVCATVRDWWSGLPGWEVLGIEPSPILGPEGNREFLIAARRAGEG
ncbi:TlyA family RNA methyltransferase [Pseudoroseomonas ludipueritiae]|uniref:TlyA family RNA methyltransferase n=1 Tax=Pseudoroseomonas ludipueritiae TaxID=198093 RepID=A0ABR7RCS1_9PROT|nr:TlyA family RNA methyltransferase [Pseudoroseomonas ludipueritiae]MBC9179636.1 TlyA family RNA methyltransferase [Pseudoroseomonas ludipueritiae]